MCPRTAAISQHFAENVHSDEDVQAIELKSQTQARRSCKSEISSDSFLFAGGTGSFGCARWALDNSTGRFYVVRRIQRGSFHVSNAVLENTLEKWVQLDHPHVRQAFGYTFVNQEVQVHLEGVGFGTLGTFVAEFGPLTDHMIKRVTEQSLDALAYLHAQEPPLVHGTLRADTILLHDGMQVKLSEYGFASMGVREAPPGDTCELQWTAPEVVQESVEDLPKTDVWSFGCTLIEMVTGHRPWGSADENWVLAALVGLHGHASKIPAIPSSAPLGLQALMKYCLRRNPSERPTAIAVAKAASWMLQPVRLGD